MSNMLTNYALLCPSCKKLQACVLRRVDEAVREACVGCGHVYQVQTVKILQDLLMLSNDPDGWWVDRLAQEALRQRLIRPHAGKASAYVEPYRQPQRITDFHEGRSRGRALVAQGRAAYRSR